MPESKPFPGAIEFELTDFDAARQVLDLPPPGVLESLEMAPEYWKARRRAPAPTDRALTGLTMAWATGLPATARPIKLCERFPRVANAIAHEWAKRQECESLLADLLTGRRNARKGFPADVRDELMRLAELRSTAPGTPAGR